MRATRLSVGDSPARKSRETARVVAALGEDVVEHMRTGQGVADVPVHQPPQPRLARPLVRLRLHDLRELGELAVRHEGQERLAVREMVVDRHRRDADRIGHPTHADRLAPLLFQDGERGGGDIVGGVLGSHLYSVTLHRIACNPLTFVIPEAPQGAIRDFPRRAASPRRSRLYALRAPAGMTERRALTNGAMVASVRPATLMRAELVM